MPSRATVFYSVVVVAMVVNAWLLSVSEAMFTIPLERSTVKEKDRTKVLLGLKLRQKRLASNSHAAGPAASLLEEKEVPLSEEILSEKHLATYFGTIAIDQTPFRVLFDTGSCEFWIPSEACQTSRCSHHHRLPVQQSVRLATRTPMNIQYLSGKVQGDMALENVKLGDITVNNQVVGVAKVVDIELLDDVKWDGILGLAFPNPTLTAQGITPIFDTIIKSHVLTSRHLANQFAYYIDDSHGAVTFGGANCDFVANGKDKRSCIDKFKFVPVTEKTYWTVTLKDVQVQYPGRPAQSGFCPQQGCKAIVDTGTYLIYGPENQVSSMLTRTLHTCQDYKQMPTFTFVFFTGVGNEPVHLTLKPIDYILKFNIDRRKECVVGISPDKDTIWTLGQVFLRSFYTVFDRDEDRIGFARLDREKFRAVNAKSSRSDAASLIEMFDTTPEIDNF